MITLEQFAKQSAKEYLHSIVFVDDEIYDTGTGHPVESSLIAPRFKSPFASRTSQPEATTSPPPPSQEKPPYHPKHLLESFAQQGMVCALYEPKEDFGTDAESELFKLCARADVVILDWDLYNMDGTNFLPLITNLVSESQNTVPHHVRLCAIYTTKPNLQSVANTIYEHLKAVSLQSDAVGNSLTLTIGATRIIVLGKPGVVGRSADLKSAEVQEEDLANRIIDEFSKMHLGILPAFALHGLAKVRLNSKRILDKFHRDMDGTFLLHRAALLETEDAFEQLPDLIAEEALAVLVDEQVSSDVSASIAQSEANEIAAGTCSHSRKAPARGSTQNVLGSYSFLRDGSRILGVGNLAAAFPEARGFLLAYSHPLQASDNHDWQPRLCLERRKVLSQRVDLKYIREVARRLLRQVDCNAVRVTRPHQVGLRTEQSYPGDFATVIARIRSERFNDELAIRGPSQRDGVKRVAFGGKPHIARSELREPAVRRGAGTLGRSLAGYLPRPGGVDRLVIDRHPGTELVQKSEFVVVRPAMAGQRNVQQQIAVLADDIYE